MLGLEEFLKGGGNLMSARIIAQFCISFHVCSVIKQNFGDAGSRGVNLLVHSNNKHIEILKKINKQKKSTALVLKGINNSLFWNHLK